MQWDMQTSSKYFKYAGVYDSIWNSLQFFPCFTYLTENLPIMLFLQGKMSTPEKSGAAQRFCVVDRDSCPGLYDNFHMVAIIYFIEPHVTGTLCFFIKHL